MAKKFNLADLMGDVSNLDTSPELTIEQIPLSQIDGNSKNFYAVESVDELKDSIALIGLKQPLVVLPADGRYRLIAGHRRYKALSELGKETAPCVIQSSLTETEEQLALILTNSTARELTYPEKMKQACQLKELFMKRREEGAELPGRIRDMVAEAMNESASNIARMEATNKHLISGWKKELNEKRISASTAYEISRLPKEVQKKLKAEYLTGVSLRIQTVKAAAGMAEYPFAPLNCPLHKGAPCTRYAERAAMVADGTCPGCCDQCDHQDGCPALCGLCKSKIAHEKESAKRQEEDREKDEAYQHSAYRQAQLSLMQWARNKRFDGMAEWNALPYTVKFFRDLVEPSRTLWSPNLRDLFEMADLLKISLPELLGIAPELPPCTSEWHKYPVDKPDEGETVLCQYGSSDGVDLFALRVYQDEKWGLSTNGQFAQLKMKVKYWTRAFPEV